MNITIVDEELPYPAVSGKRIRILNLAAHLSKRHQITFLCHRNADAEEARRAEEYLNHLGIRVVLVDRQSPTLSGILRKAAFCARIASNMFSAVPYSVQWNNCRHLQEAVRHHAAEHPVDLWQCEWAPYATALLPLKGARWVMMAHDIQSLIWERYYRSTRNPIKRLYIKRQWLRYRRYERQVFSEAPLTITVTQQDARRATEQFGAQSTATVDNGVDVDHYQSFNCHHEIKRKPNEILFLGNLEWRANIDAVRTLLEQVFPKVLAEEPSARLRVVGRRPSQSLQQQCHRVPNVEVHADVPDVRPYLYGCGAMAVPLRIGGGSRLKILEALACGLPVVSTGVGAEGLHLNPGQHYSQADDAAEMARILIRWIRDPSPALSVAKAGQHVVESQYDWGVLAKKMERAWDRLCSPTESLVAAEHP